MFTVNSFKRLGAILERSLPNRCLLCQQRCLVSQGLCDVCLQDGEVGPLCLGCSCPLPNMSTSMGTDTYDAANASHHYSNNHYCGACLRQPSSGKRSAVICAYPYHHPVGQLVGAIKFKKQLSLLEPLCATFARRVQHLWQQGAITKPDALVAVPMHTLKLRQRGFNHAALIAHHLGQHLRLPVLEHLVIKRRETAEQHGLNGIERRKNLAGCFTVSESYSMADHTARKNVALVDDVITTGTTFASLERALQPSGYHVSQYWALASALHR